jgi:hypothetical protein
LALAFTFFLIIPAHSTGSEASILAFIFQDDTFITCKISTAVFNPQVYAELHQPPALPDDLPGSWDVRNALDADFTGDDIAELALLVWRPWRDWPFMRWSKGPSPIADFHDEQGDSCHIILIDPNPGGKSSERSLTLYKHSYREIWAGSALPVPLVQIAAGDVNGDGLVDLVALEGDYESGRDGAGHCVSIWQWNGFGFTMEWRSEPGCFAGLAVQDVNNDEIIDIIAW